jgi:hypothetical protein
MAWSVIMFGLPTHIRSVQELPENSKPTNLGTKTDIISILYELFPDGNFSQGFGRLSRSGFSIEFSMDTNDPVTWFGVRVHGADTAIEAIKLLCERTG